MSFALENKHKQSRENIEKTNNNLGKAKKPWETQKNKRTKRPMAGPPPFLKTSPELFFLVLLFFVSQGFFVFLAFPRLLLVFSRCFVFSYLGQSVSLLFRSTFKYVSLSLTQRHMFFALTMKASEPTTPFVLVEISMYKSVH